MIDLVGESRDKVQHNSWVCDNGDIHEDKTYFERRKSSVEDIFGF